MELKAAQDAYADLHEKEPYHDGTFTAWSAKRNAEFPFHHSHGVSFGVAREDLTPWDAFTTNRDASPIPPPPAGSETADPGPGEDPDGPSAAPDAAD